MNQEERIIAEGIRERIESCIGTNDGDAGDLLDIVDRLSRDLDLATAMLREVAAQDTEYIDVGDFGMSVRMLPDRLHDRIAAWLQEIDEGDE